MPDTFQTKNPDSKKKGVNIDKEKYEMIKDEIVGVLLWQPGMTHTELNDTIAKKLGNTFKGDVGWYVETVKLDLEARKLIKRRKKGAKDVYALA